MKYFSKIVITLALFPAWFLYSCKKDSFTSANINPNDPTVVVPANILPAVEMSLAYTQGGDLSRYSTLFMQHSVGFSRQAQAYYNYVLTSNDVDNSWGNIYTSVLGNNKDLMTRADAGKYNQYSGISRILTAYTLQLLVDEWGKIPYSQALLGDGNTHPVFDDDRALYDTIVSLVDKALEFLNDPDPGALTPGGDDFIYGGDVSKWIKFAHAIKARIYIHQSKNNAAMATLALDEANMSFESNEDNADLVFGTAETAANPVYQFNSQRADIDYAAGAFVDMMTANNDPRLTKLIAPNYDDINGVGIADYYGAINGHVEFITYDEILFIKAEATLRSTGSIGTAQSFYRDAITANMEKLGVEIGDISTYLATFGNLPSSINDAIAQVAQEEYFALYLNPESWTVWRRTGSPNLTPIAGSNGIPRRYLYPQSEYSLNATNVPPNVTLFSPLIFWDN